MLQNLAKGGSKSNWSIVLAASDILIFLRQGDENTISKTLGYITMMKKGFASGLARAEEAIITCSEQTPSASDLPDLSRAIASRTSASENSTSHTSDSVRRKNEC